MRILYKKVLLLSVIGLMISCNKQVSNAQTTAPEEKTPCEPVLDLSKEKLDRFGITNKEYLSSASKRALQWKYVENDWFRAFRSLKPLKGDLAYEAGVVRRDPSAMIKENGKYYVWYSKSVSVFTVEIMKHDNMYYLCYQTVKSPYNVRVKNQVGLAWSNSPNGPWTKSAEPILSPADNGVWKGTEQNRFLVEKKGDFDSHKVHDPCILPFKGKFYLYYKGEQMGEEILFGGRQIRHGVAIADNPKGPYVKSKYNPISNSGHEICVWPTQGGIASLITTDGPERNTIQWAADGINFEIRAAVQTHTTPPHAIGLNRTIEVPDDNPTKVFDWGLSHIYNNSDEQSIMRFSSYIKTSHVAKGAPDKKKK